ncbi:hypothetical protein CEE35_05980 [Candidatus Aerophobetes bacterium Ae_b3b]|nr:MAG: hypothetical protein CEE35_05980 [Candidatus Aerophobetes bacterium Ae_b3b]
MKKGLWVRGAVLSFIVVVILTGNVFAEQGDYEKILKLKDEIIKIQNQGELGFRNFILCSKIITFGHYVALPEPKVKVGTEEVLVYAEPANYFTNTQGERYEIWLTLDMIVFDENGEVLLEKTDALSAHFNTATPILDISFPLTIYLNTVPVGKYTFKVVLHDVLRDTEANKTVDFEVVE